MPTKVASAKPGEHKVRVGRKTYVYARVRKLIPDEDPVTLNGMNLIHYIAKESLRVVKQIFKVKT